MAAYANQTEPAPEGLPPFLTMVVEAMAFQSVTTFWAGSMPLPAVIIQTSAARNVLFFMSRPLAKFTEVPHLGWALQARQCKGRPPNAICVSKPKLLHS